MSKVNARLSVVRPLLLAVALILTVIAVVSPAFAACTNGATRTITVNPVCCGSVPPPKATRQRQICQGGVWVNQGGTFCGAVSACAI